MLKRVAALLVLATLPIGATVDLPRTDGVVGVETSSAAEPFLAELAATPSADLPDVLASGAAEVALLQDAPPPPAAIRSWWGSLQPEQQRTLRTEAAYWVGDLEGVPYDARDAANRHLLVGAIADARTSVDDGVGRGRTKLDARRLAMLEGIATSIGGSAAVSGRQLITLDVTGTGEAAVAFGDLGTAEQVAFIVPGMYYALDTQLALLGDTAEDVRAEAQQWLPHFGRGDETVAAVAWIGFETPDFTTVIRSDIAEGAASSLARAIDGLQDLRGGSAPYVSVLAHSYGSTTAMLALQSGEVTVDALAVVGSPGSAAETASELSVAPGHVFVGEADWDPVVGTGFFGTDPGDASFGAKRLGVQGGLDPITTTPLGSISGHFNYFDPGSEAMRNFGLVVIGEDHAVTDGSTSPSGVLAISR